ncbi:fumarylacetoacetate hydrolase family protein [Pseudonocardia kunmingensis]|uniref:2-keto-4-pentenoate hydratase/2-oxohepta-3-ene-1,7-dioic acid hydratase in catechol pathway n=1 Tax=Pseudonocardia kunmingensis TaxID=630975 RepID=A0A543CX51_9PSEU|nr:fumarylacetoacetate hydrolase family protein [Pseudonocardia kunmingensis]TQM01641.1 2-keto-4-pentenoate hydratase/2-oxohepta-3-ene-1,7-dioic acid hydratase in catechol pathway [Pseudonocardia kunmingensis]
MRLATFDEDRIGVVQDDHVLDVTSLVEPLGTGTSAMRRLITNWGELDLSSATGPRRPLAEVRLEAPVPDPTKVIAAPVNYRDHQSEMSQASHVSSLGFFLKAPSSLLRPQGTVQLPYTDRRFDQEGELACVIGRQARAVSPEDALSYVFGYTGLLDITMRGGEDRSTRKSFETFTPMGPWLVTADEFGPPVDVDLRCWVTGNLRQRANTADLIWDVARLVSYASWVTTLEPGDILTTGTPAGVGPLQDGDTIELDLARIGGVLRVTVSAGGAGTSHTLGRDTGPVPPPALTWGAAGSASAEPAGEPTPS